MNIIKSFVDTDLPVINYASPLMSPLDIHPYTLLNSSAKFTVTLKKPLKTPIFSGSLYTNRILRSFFFHLLKILHHSFFDRAENVFVAGAAA